MTVLVRKLSNRRNVDVIRNSDSVDDISADVVSEEFKTKGNRLSVWEISDSDVDIGILAISLSSSRIESMDFIILDKEVVEKSGLVVESTEPANNPLKQARAIHRDICNLRLQDFRRLAEAYKCAVASEANVIRYTKQKLNEKIGLAIKKGWIDGTYANDKIKETLDSLE